MDLNPVHALPPEIVLHILASLRPHELTQIARSSKSLYELALPLLYTSIRLRTWNAAVSCLATLQPRADIATHVKYLRLPPDPTPIEAYKRFMGLELARLAEEEPYMSDLERYVFSLWLVIVYRIRPHLPCRFKAVNQNWSTAKENPRNLWNGSIAQAHSNLHNLQVYRFDGDAVAAFAPEMLKSLTDRRSGLTSLHLNLHPSRWLLSQHEAETTGEFGTAVEETPLMFPSLSSLSLTCFVPNRTSERLVRLVAKVAQKLVSDHILLLKSLTLRATSITNLLASVLVERCPHLQQLDVWTQRLPSNLHELTPNLHALHFVLEPRQAPPSLRLDELSLVHLDVFEGDSRYVTRLGLEHGSFKKLILHLTQSVIIPEPPKTPMNSVSVVGLHVLSLPLHHAQLVRIREWLEQLGAEVVTISGELTRYRMLAYPSYTDFVGRRALPLPLSFQIRLLIRISSAVRTKLGGRAAGALNKVTRVLHPCSERHPWSERLSG